MTLSPLDEHFLALREYTSAPCIRETCFSSKYYTLPGIVVYAEWNHHERPQWSRSLRVGDAQCFVLMTMTDCNPKNYRVLAYKMPNEPFETMNDDDLILFNQLWQGKISENIAEIVVQPHAIQRLTTEFFRHFNDKIPAINGLVKSVP